MSSFKFLIIGSVALGVLVGCNTAPTPQPTDTTALDQEYFPDQVELQSLLIPDGTRPFPALSKISKPSPTNSSIINQAAAIQLGKAMFWDVQVSGDGRVACATCHFQGGADPRQFNIVSPYRKSDGSLTFENTVSAVNKWMNFDSMIESRAVFPQLPDNEDHRFVNYVAFGSPGVASATFNSINTNTSVASDNCTAVSDPVFGNYRQVTNRNAPTTIGAVFNRVQFWDGRANAKFNGLNPFGFTQNNLEGSITDMSNSSLASQAVGPVNNEIEMSCKGRGFHSSNGVAAKLLPRKPLQFQSIAYDDSVLGTMADKTTGKGLSTTYQAMINKAFNATVAQNSLTKFSLIWGEALQAYMATLVPDQTPFDRWLAGGGIDFLNLGFSGAMTRNQLYGFEVFRDSTKGNCLQCHAGTELTDASVNKYNEAIASGKTADADGTDLGFHNIGNTPPDHNTEFGRAGKGPGGVPFSENITDKNLRAFKTPGLRNVKLTAPFFHNGRAISLHDVIDFYENPEKLGFLGKDPHVSPRMRTLHLTSNDHKFLDDFLKNALTDCRVEMEKAPFDHPSLVVPLGESSGADKNIYATGATGKGFCN